MSTPVTVAAIVGAFVLGLLLGVPLAYALAKRRLAAAVSIPVELPTVPKQPEPTKILEELVPQRSRRAATHVITSVGEPDVESDAAPRTEFKPRPQLDQVARTVLIEAASLAHGVRNALSEENRAKLSYEIKRELIRLRKDRKAEVKEALREYRAKHRGPARSDEGEGV